MKEYDIENKENKINPIGGVDDSKLERMNRDELEKEIKNNNIEENKNNNNLNEEKNNEINPNNKELNE